MTNRDKALSLHKKRFGQYFSGEKVASMLFTLLPEDTNWGTVVDPMAGVGDMLKTVYQHSPNSVKILGVEIDEAVAAECSKNAPYATIINNDAFCCDALLTNTGWDLVITNPPYVRYQLQGSDDEGVMPTGTDIRANLTKQINNNSYLTEAERQLFLKVTKHYSGLSDMAVPAWILCASLVKRGGYLAIVVPETWLNRDYAAPIQYLISKLFQIETIARDITATWFSDAQVNTCLIVAKRKDMSAVQNEYMTTLLDLDEEGRVVHQNTQKTSSLFPNMYKSSAVPKWALDEDISLVSGKGNLPYELANLTTIATNYINLSDLGINCGQGLRTGANEFFYVNILKEEGDKYIVQSGEWDKYGTYHLPKEELILSLRKRGDISGLVVQTEDLSTGVIYLKRRAEGEMLALISSAEEFRDPKGRHFKDYSAVKPNEKIIDGKTVRYWYMLPEFYKRHLPNLCMTRISGDAAECLYVMQDANKPIAVDANMVTLWSEDTSIQKAAFAILNSTWCKLYLELLCTVMGGGALKVETSHLKKMLLPALSEEQLYKLEIIGDELIGKKHMTDEIQNEIDVVICSPFCDKGFISKSRELLEHKIIKRRKQG